MMIMSIIPCQRIKTLMNINLAVIPTVIGELGTIPEGK